MTEDPALTVAALRAAGAQQVDPVRFHYIEALARRAAGHAGALRQVLDHKLATVLADYAERQARAGADNAGSQAQPSPGPAPAGPLAGLVQALNVHATATADDQPPELKALQQFRSTWTRLSVDRQLTRSLAKTPENPGPLNSHLLLLRALQSMQDIAPGYLHRFMAHADALLWLDQARDSTPAARPARGSRPAKR